MKESKQGCSSSSQPKPNLKNKNFVNWSKAVSCKQEDNIVSSEWHEKLKTIKPFLPAYDNKPVNMIYLLSGEYGRIWRKERDEWYGKVFVPKAKEKDMSQRKKKIRQQIKESRKAAEASIRERKERRAKEIEAKAKADAEKAEKIKAKIQKQRTPKLQPKTQKKSKDIKSMPDFETTEEKEKSCPEGWKPVELTLQCECSDHVKDADAAKETTDKNPEKETSVTEKKETEPETQESDKSCTMCDGYIKQLQEVQEAKSKMKEPNTLKDE